MDQILSTVDNTLGSILQNFIQKPTIIRGVVHLFLILYAARLAPVPPKQVLALFDNVYFKLAVFSLILWSAQFSPSTSILIALAFMVTVNYTTTGKVWEMMENISQSQPVAPSKDAAMSAMTTNMNNQVSNAPVVGSIAQNPNTIVITPSVVQTENGPAIVNPTVVIAPAMVSTPSGQMVTITPDVTTMSAPNTSSNMMTNSSMTTTNSSTPAPMSTMPSSVTNMAPITPTSSMTPTVSQSIEAVKILSQAAMSPAASDHQSVVSIANVAVANINNSDGAQAIDHLVKQAIVAEAGDSNKVKNSVNSAIDSISSTGEAKESDSESKPAQANCFPTRQYDMSRVKPQTDGVDTFEDYQTWAPTK